ncbi:hypothetical protein A3Q56_06629, partial [Intoshia linei]
MTKNCKVIANGTAVTYDPNNVNIVSKYFERVGRHTFVEGNGVINLIWPCDTNDLKLFIKILKKIGKLKKNGLMEKMYSFFKFEFDRHLFIEAEDTLQSIPHKRNYNREILNSQESILKAIVIWLNYQPFNRKRYILQLLNCIRLSQLNPCDIYVLFFNNFYNSNPINRELVDQFYSNVCKYHALPTEHKLAKKRREERYPNQVMLLMGGWNEKGPCDEIEIYNIYTNVWHLIEGKLCINKKKLHFAYHGLIQIDKKIYIIGGYNGKECLSTLYCYRLDLFKMEKLANMQVARCY